jgi:hypothetical protein
MRLRYLLPAVEITVSVAFVFVPLWRYLPSYRLKGPDGREIVCHFDCPTLPSLYRIDPVTFAWEVNRPAVVLVLSILSATWDYSQDGHDYFHDPVWRGVGLALSGIIVWFFVGRFFDDLIMWRRTKVLQRIRILDLIFALNTSVVATVTAIGTLAFQGTQLYDLPWFIFWSMFWILVGYSGVTMRILQVIQTRRDARSSSLINWLP